MKQSFAETTLQLFCSFHPMLVSLISVDILLHYLDVTWVKQEA